MNSKQIINKTNQLGAHNYQSKEVVIVKGKGAIAYDVEGKQYIDMLSAYSALNFGHCHSELVEVATQQLNTLTLTSRAFHNSLLCEFYEEVSKLTGKQKVLPMNTGAEAVETALKAARKWGAYVKKVPEGKQHIICCENNFHGRTITIVSMSSDPLARTGYGPYTDGFTIIPFNDTDALEKAITPNTVAFLVEPIQGEAGVIIPDKGYLAKVREVCSKNNVLMISDEVQTGFARTGAMFATDHDGVKPDIYILGKALGGGIMPVSAIAADSEIMDVFEPGSHGSTFGGNPLACAVSIKALQILVRDNYAEMARVKGEKLLNALKQIKNKHIVEVRGKGLLIAIEFDFPCSELLAKLISKGVLAKETHEKTIRFAPPIIITEQQLDQAIAIIQDVLSE